MKGEEKMRFHGGIMLAALLASEVLGCGGNHSDAKVAQNADGTSIKTIDGKELTQAAQNKYKEGIDGMAVHDKANDWNEASCAEVARRFDAAAEENKDRKFAEATYNAGLVYQRCNNEKEAKERFQKALRDSPKFHYARSQLALYQFKADNNADAAISELDRVVTDASFQNVPALVNLAMFQMQRDATRPGGDNCKTAGKDNREVELADFECAKLNLQRALAIDDSYMPAFNQLALYYFNGAKKRALGAKSVGGRRSIETSAAMSKRADVQELELASLVCSQAIRKNANYAPIHNTHGLILNELGLTNGAVVEFNDAVRLDPHFFEAYMNLAAINLSFRGFDKAQKAYEQAIQMRPNDYDAHLGLALAIRGQIADAATYDSMVSRVQSELDTCKKLEPARPDAYFNEGILIDEYKSKGGADGAKAIPIYEQAKATFQTFVDKAQNKPEYDGAVKKAKDRMQDIDDKVNLIKLASQASQTPPSASSGAADGGAPPPAH